MYMDHDESQFEGSGFWPLLEEEAVHSVQELLRVRVS